MEDSEVLLVTRSTLAGHQGMALQVTIQGKRNRPNLVEENDTTKQMS